MPPKKLTSFLLPKKNYTTADTMALSFFLSFAALGEIDDSNVLPAVVLFSREPIEFETAAYLSVCVMEKSMYVSAGGWDKSFVFYDDGVMNSQNNTTTKKALTPF